MPRVLSTLTVAACLVLGFAVAPARAESYVPADDGGRIVDVRKVDDQTLDLTIDTPLVDTSKPRIRLYTPAGWSRDADRTWPIVYAYGGGPGDYTEWAGAEGFPETAKRSGALVALVDGGKRQGFTDWYNGGKGGNPRWETFHTTEVPQLLERNFRASQKRAAMGISSGGQGAITYAARHPGLFAYVSCFSGVLHLTGAGVPLALMFTDYATPEPTVPDPLAKWGNPVFDAKNWADHDPYVRAEGLRGTGLFLSAGDGTQGPLDDDLATDVARDGLLNGVQLYLAGAAGEAVVGATTRDLAERLARLAIPATTDLYGPGFHQWEYWIREYKKAWPLMMNAIGAHP